MRFVCVTLFAAMLSPGGALASSFVTLPAEKASISTSMIFLGEPAPAVVAALERKDAPAAEVALNYPIPARLYGGAAQTAPVIVSPSIIALGEPAVENFKVAAIEDEKPARRPNLSPMVIRGGISGDAFTPSVTPASQEAAPRQATAPASRKGPTEREPAPEPERAPAAPPPPRPSGGPIKGAQR